MTNAENIYKAFGIRKGPWGMSWGNEKGRGRGKRLASYVPWGHAAGQNRAAAKTEKRAKARVPDVAPPKRSGGFTPTSADPNSQRMGGVDFGQGVQPEGKPKAKPTPKVENMQKAMMSLYKISDGYTDVPLEKGPMGMSRGNKKDRLGTPFPKDDVRYRERALTPLGAKAKDNRRSERMYGPGSSDAKKYPDWNDPNRLARKPESSTLDRQKPKSLSEADIKQRIANQLFPSAGFDPPEVFGGAPRPKKGSGAEGKSKANPTPKVENMQKAMISLQKFLDDCECDD